MGIIANRLPVVCRPKGDGTWNCQKDGKRFDAENITITDNPEGVFVGKDNQLSFRAVSCKPFREGDKSFLCSNEPEIFWGEKLQEAWKEYLKDTDKKAFERMVNELFVEQPPEEEFETPYMYLVFCRDEEGKVNVCEDTVDFPDYWTGTSHENLVAPIPLYPGMTLEDLQNFDAVEETGWYDIWGLEGNEESE